MSYQITDAFEYAFGIGAAIPCLLLIGIYMANCSKLSIPCIMKLEFTISLLIIIVLRLLKYGGKVKHLDDEILAILRAIFESTILFILTSMTFFSLLTAKYIDVYKKHKKLLTVSLSLASLVASVAYVLGFTLTTKATKKNPKYACASKVYLIRIQAKLITDYVVFGILLTLNLIFFSIIIKELVSLKKSNENVPFGKAVRMLIASILLFIAEIANLVIVYNSKEEGCDTDAKGVDIIDFINLFYLAVLILTAWVYCIDNLVKDEILKIIGKCAGFERPRTESDVSSDDDDDDDNEDEQIFVDSNANEQGKMNLYDDSERPTTT